MTGCRSRRRNIRREQSGREQLRALLDGGQLTPIRIAGCIEDEL